MVMCMFSGKLGSNRFSARGLEKERESENLSGNANELTVASCFIIAKGVENMALPSFHKIFLFMLQSVDTSGKNVK